MKNMHKFALKWIGANEGNIVAQRIIKGQIDGYIRTHHVLNLWKSRSNQCQNLKVHKLGVKFGYAMAFPKNSPFKKPIDKVLLELEEKGVLTELQDSWRVRNCPIIPSPKQKDVTVYIALFTVLLVFTSIIILIECVVHTCRGRSYNLQRRVIVV